MFIIEFIKNLIHSTFNKTKKLSSGIEINTKKNINNNFINNLQKGIKDDYNKNEILNKINKNPIIIDSLSYERLVQLNKLYEEKIKEYEKKLNI